MAFSLPQVESKTQISPPSHLDIEQGHQDKTSIEDIYDQGFGSSWDFFATSMRLAVIGLLLSMLAIYVKQSDECSDPVQHKLSVNLLKIFDGESSASENVNLTPIDVMKDPMEAALTYEENENLELCDLFESECFLMEAHEEESTTESEQEQPNVNDTMIQDIAED